MPDGKQNSIFGGASLHNLPSCFLGAITQHREPMDQPDLPCRMLWLEKPRWLPSCCTNLMEEHPSRAVALLLNPGTGVSHFICFQAQAALTRGDGQGQNSLCSSINSSSGAQDKVVQSSVSGFLADSCYPPETHNLY